MYAYCSNNPVLYCDATGFTETVVNPVTGELVVIPDGGLPSSAELAAVDICFKTDVNHDHTFNYNDINRIVSYYNADRNDVIDLVRMLRPIDSIVNSSKKGSSKKVSSKNDSSKNDSSINNTNYSRYSPRAPYYNGDNQQTFSMSEEQVDRCLYWLGVAFSVAGHIAEKYPNPKTKVVGEIAKWGGYVISTYEFYELYLQ